MFDLAKYVCAIVFLQLALAHAALAALGPAVAGQNPGPPDTPRTGMAPPAGNAYPAWYQDANGLTLAHCLDNMTTPAGLCVVLGLPDAAMPQTFFGNVAPENFYWLADSNLTALASAVPNRVVYRAALESSFFGAPNIADGQQIVFARIRIRIDAPVAGTYTVKHPFGVYTQNVAAPGIRAIDVTQDIGCLPAGTPPCNFTLALADPPSPVIGTPKSIGPFLIWDAGLPITDASGNIYVGNPLVPHTVTGSTFLDPVLGAQNFLRIEGPAGSGIGPAGADFIQDNTFKVSGKLARGPLAMDDNVPDTVNTPVTIMVLANDIQPPPGATINPATVMIVAPPAHGTAAANPDGTVTYTPTTEFRGNDSFKYNVMDTGNPGAMPPIPTAPATSNSATVNIMIPTTTSTTVPCVTPRCMLDKALNGAECSGQSIPQSIRTKFDLAVKRIDQSETSSGKKAKKLRMGAKQALKQAKKMARKAAKGKKAKLTLSCATALGSAADTVAGSL